MTLRDLPQELCPLDSLRPHPRNYRTHPPDQMEHLKASITEHGVYRNVVIAQDGTILAGHGVVQACRLLEMQKVWVYRLPISPDSPAALKVLAGDNEIAHLAQVDDRTFTELLSDIQDLDSLLGTGYDEMMLANLVYVTRPASEVPDEDAAAEWAKAGLPTDQNGPAPLKLVVNFRSEEDRERFASVAHLSITQKTSTHWTCWWPPREREDLTSLRFEKAEAEAEVTQ